MSTTLIAIRHAKPLSEGFADEKLRPLHKEGITTQESITRKLEEMGYAPHKIFSSPILRAVQTAAIIARHFSLDVEETNALGYDFDKSALLAKLPRPDENLTIVFVGHAPHLGEFVNELVGERVLIDGLCKSGTAILTLSREIGPGKAKFVEYIKP